MDLESRWALVLLFLSAGRIWSPPRPTLARLALDSPGPLPAALSAPSPPLRLLLAPNFSPCGMVGDLSGAVREAQCS